MSKTIGIIGSRRRNSPDDYLLVQEAFYQIYKKGDVVCSGLCWKGGDQFAIILADIEDAGVIWHPANWNNGIWAGFARNTYIATDSDVLIACVAHDRKGGTEDTIKKFKKKHPNNVVYIL
jgi:hypothetical protein